LVSDFTFFKYPFYNEHSVTLAKYGDNGDCIEFLMTIKG